MKARLVNAVVRVFRREILRDPFLLQVKRWFRDDGDNTLRLSYPLDATSVVWDLGGYHGDFAAEILQRYGSQIFIFEPVPNFYTHCAKRFDEKPGVQCLPFGLSREAGWFNISDNEDASSFVRDAGSASYVRAEIRPISAMFDELGVDEVTLLKINIEGGEFDVIPALMDADLIQRVQFIQVQFHDFIPDAHAKRKQIRRRLAETHQEMWNYPFVWECWELK
jgi:FkbM family methyltransferase